MKSDGPVDPSNDSIGGTFKSLFIFSFLMCSDKGLFMDSLRSPDCVRINFFIKAMSSYSFDYFEDLCFLRLSSSESHHGHRFPLFSSSSFLMRRILWTLRIRRGPLAWWVSMKSRIPPFDIQTNFSFGNINEVMLELHDFLLLSYFFG